MNKEEAMKILKDFHDKSALFSVRTALDTIFPELRESEDDEVRKAIIELVKQSSEILSKQNQNNMLTWLEKQGYTKKDVDDAYLKGICNTKHELEKQGEQKPADKVEPKFKVKYAGSEYNVFETKDIAGVTFYGIEDEPNHIDYVKAENCEIISVYAIKENGSPYPTKPAVFSEKKPQRMISAEAKEALWSDKYEGLTDFERTLADICIGWIGEEPGWKQYIKDNADVLLKIAIEKFNSVQDIPFEQKSAEWSEEDEVKINRIVDCLENLNVADNDILLKDVDWLKSLLRNRVKPQPDMVEALRTEYEKGRADTIAEMKSSWSEEDEKVIAIINNALTESNTLPDDYDKVYDWLESLRKRIGG